MSAAAAHRSVPAELAGAFDWRGASGQRTYGITALFFFGLVWMMVSLAPPAGSLGALLAVFVGAAYLAFVGQTRRRVRDIGWRGGWTWAAFVPWIGLFFSVFLLFKKPADAPRQGEPAILRKLGFCVALVVALLFASRAFWQPFSIPSGSMKPTLLVGDYLAMVPLRTEPQRGDVVVFRHPVQGSDYIDRVMALPGDRIAMENGQVVLNGQVLTQTPLEPFREVMERQGPFGTMPACANQPVARGEICEKARFREVLPDGRSYEVLDIRTGQVDDTETFEVPEGHVFVMGDNRDNALDSRISLQIGGVGFVPIENVLGRAARVLFSSGDALGRIWRRIE